MQARRMVVQPGLLDVQTAFAGSQRLVGALQKGLLPKQSTLWVGQQGRALVKGALTPSPSPEERGEAPAPNQQPGGIPKE